MQALALLLEELADDPPDRANRERWRPIIADRIDSGMVLRDPDHGWLANDRIVLVETRLVAPHGSRDEELGMVTFSYVDVERPTYRNGAAYLPDMVLERWE